MNENPPAPLSSAVDFPNLNPSINDAVRAHRRRMRVLTGAAFLLGFLAIAASFMIVAAYFALYRPKQMQLLRDVTMAAEAARTPPGPTEHPPPRHLDFPSVQATMTHVLSVGTMLVAVAVGFLAAGTLVMLALVVFQRRATLQQINVSLAQISAQLKEMPSPPTQH